MTKNKKEHKLNLKVHLKILPLLGMRKSLETL